MLEQKNSSNYQYGDEPNINDHLPTYKEFIDD